MSEGVEDGGRAGSPLRVAGRRNDLEPPIEPESPFYKEFGINAGLVEEIQDSYRIDPNSVDASWQAEFGAATDSPRLRSEASSSATRIRPSPRPGVSAVGSALKEEADEVEIRMADRYARVLRLIDFYRARGHRIADSDPLGEQSSYFPELDPGHYGLGHEDLDRKFICGDLPGGAVQTLREILERLRQIYCGTIGFEYSHVQDPGRKSWLRENFEEEQKRFSIDKQERTRIYEALSRSELFEHFLHTKFIG
ncbi:MAG: hypothetical protein VCC04_05115, partial [Myxococcota bacterium]